MGGFPAGGGVRVSCLLGVNDGLVVLLLLLSGFFPFLFLVRVAGAIELVNPGGWVVSCREKKIPPRVREIGRAHV